MERQCVEFWGDAWISQAMVELWYNVAVGLLDMWLQICGAAEEKAWLPNDEDKSPANPLNMD